MSDSAYLYKTSCDQCGSSDGNGVFSDGHTYCFVCHHYEPGEGGVAEAPAPQRSRDLLKVRYQALAKRGLTIETCRKFGYGIAEDRHGRTVQVAPYRNDKGTEVVAQHLRYPDKEMPWVGLPKQVGQAFGQHLWKAGGKRVIVTEGEIDCMTVSQVQDNKWPVVSIWSGAGNAHKDIAKIAAWLESFDEIVLMFDDDGPGQEAAVECAQLLRPGSVKIATIAGFKDASDAMQAGRSDLIMQAIWNARTYRPDGINTVEEVIDEACAPVEWGTPWPWPALTKVTYGTRGGTLYAYGGGVGCGKTELFKELIHHFALRCNRKVGVIFLEETPAHTLKVLAGKVAGQRFHVPGVEYDPEEVRKAALQYSGKVFLYDHFGAKDWSAVRAQIRYMVQALGVQHVLLDHLTALVAGVEDERRALDKIMEEMASDAIAWGHEVHFISHLTTPQGTPHEEGGRVLEKHFTGSRAIARWSHFMFGIERNKQEPDTPSVFRVLKDRYTGDANGFTFGLRWVREEGRLVECDLDEEGASYAEQLENDDF